MANGMTLDERIAAFNKKYQTKFSLKALETLVEKFKYLDDYLFEKPKEVTPQHKYYTGLTRLWKDYIEQTTQMAALNEPKSYDMSKVDAVGFLHDYEQIIAQNHAENGKGERKAYEGIKVDKLLDGVLATTAKYNRPITDVWAERIKKGNMPISNMREVTDDDHSIVRYHKGAVFTDRREEKRFENVVLAQNAMQKVCESRGWAYKIFAFPFHLYQLSYLNDLTAKVNSYRENGLPVDRVIQKYSNNMLENAYDGVAKFKQEYKERTLADKKVESEQLEKNEQVITEDVKTRESIQMPNPLEQKGDVAQPVSNETKVVMPPVSNNK